MNPTGETIPIASDHAGIEMKDRLVAELKKMGYQPDDIGAKDARRPDDYPDYAHPLAREVSRGEAKRGILRCGSGVGIGHRRTDTPGVRAALAWKPKRRAFTKAQQLESPCSRLAS